MMKTRKIKLMIGIPALLAIAIIAAVGIVRMAHASTAAAADSAGSKINGPVLVAAPGDVGTVWRGAIVGVTSEGAMVRDGSRLVLIRNDRNGNLAAVRVGDDAGWTWAWKPAEGEQVVVIQPLAHGDATRVIPASRVPAIAGVFPDR